MAKDISKLQNVLHEFRTYSYHHILIACDTSQTAAELSLGELSITNFQHPRGAKSKYNVMFTPSKGRYIVIIDGTTDTSMYIEKYAVTNVVVDNTQFPDGRQSISAGQLTSTMTIVESNGALFYNILATVCHELGSSPSSIFFLVKTIFIGYTHTEELRPITNISPFVCTLLNTTAEFNNVGATYQVTFAGKDNGVSTLPQYSGTSGPTYLGNERQPTGGNKVETKDISLAQALTAVVLNANTKNHGIMRQMQESLSDDSNASLPVESVLYEIEIDPVYQDTSKYRVVSIDERTENDTGDLYISAAGNSPIQRMLQDIVQQSPAVLQDLHNDKGPKYRCVITNTRTSSKSTSFNSSGQSVEIPLMIIKYTIKRELFPETERTLGSDTVYSLPGVPEEDILQLSYIFTGKNVDILDFNMSMQFTALQLLNLPTLPSLIVPGQANHGMVNVPPTGPASTPPTEKNDTVVQPMNPSGTPVMNPIVRNTRDPSATSKFYAVMSQMSQTETIQSTVKIHGNPRFLNDSEASTSGGPFKYVTIAIKMPDPEQSDVLLDFWFRGFYRVITYETVFEHGLFTTTLQLNSVPGKTTPYTGMTSKNPNEVQTATADPAVLNSAIDSSKAQTSIPPPYAPQTQVDATTLKKEAELVGLKAPKDQQVITTVLTKAY